MPEWTESALIIAAIGAIAAVIQQLINRESRKQEVASAGSDNLVKRLGEQVDRLEKAQSQDRRRIDWLEDELWGERHHNHQLHSGLGVVVPWGESIVVWAEGDRTASIPRPPDFVALRKLLDTPRPRRPPPPVDPT